MSRLPECPPQGPVDRYRRSQSGISNAGLARLAECEKNVLARPEYRALAKTMDSGRFAVNSSDYLVGGKRYRILLVYELGWEDDGQCIRFKLALERAA